MGYMNKMISGLLGLLVFVSCQPDDPGNRPPAGTKQTNEWIENTLREHYLWNADIPLPAKLNYNLAPEQFFESLLSLQDGKPRGINIAHYYYSTIEKKKMTTKAIGEEDNTYGFDFEAYTVVGDENDAKGYMYGRVLFVLPNSPASEAGLKRNDWIMKINGQNITASTSLLQGNAITLTLGEHTEKGITPLRTIQLSASRKVEHNPLYFNKVYTKGNSRIGYLVYTHFAAGPDNNKDNSYDETMKQIFADFKAKQVNEFILDLRYNPGGLVSCAQLLTSMLAPASSLKDKFCILKDNNNKESYYSMDIKGGVNLDLKRIYILVTHHTASASEAVINGLIPYMGRDNIVLIGTQTEGKNVGSVTYGDREGYEWLLHPITFYIFNKNGQADYSDGFTPDILFNELDGMDDYVDLQEFGNENDPSLGIALQKITGTKVSHSHSTIKSNSVQLIPVFSSLEHRGKGGLLISKSE